MPFWTEASERKAANVKLTIMSKFEINPSVSFDDWVDYCFQTDRPEDGAIASTFEMLPGVTLAQYFQRLFGDPMPYFEHRSFEEMNAGLWCLFGVDHGYWWRIRDPSVPADEQAKAVLAMKSLYRNCLDILCDDRSKSPAAGFDELNPLDGAVYMLWDMDCLEGAAMINKEEHLVGPIFSVLEEALNCKTVACQISALHGLGHLQEDNVKRVKSLIQPFIERNQAAMPWVEAYAREAIKGCVR